MFLAHFIKINRKKIVLKKVQNKEESVMDKTKDN